MASLGKRSVTPKGRCYPWAGLFGLLFLLWCGGASALSRDGTLRDLRHTAWGPREGAPDAIAGLAQTSDGYLWLASTSGLYRFDGLRFERIGLPHGDRPISSNLSAIFAPSSGGLWIGFRFGGAAFFKDGRLTTYSVQDGFPDGTVWTFAQDQSGKVWAGTRDGLARLDGSRWHGVGPEEHFSDVRAIALMVDSAGTLWVASNSKTLFLPKGEVLFRETAERSDDAANSVVGIAELPSGAVWVSRSNYLRQLAKNENPSRHPASSGTHLLADKDGGLWTMGFGGSIQRIAHPENLPTPFRNYDIQEPDLFTEADGRAVANGSLPMLEDKEGNVWITSGVGVDRFSERNVRLAPPFKNDGNTDFGSYVNDMASANQGPLWVTGSQFDLYTDSSDKPGTREAVGWVTCRLRAADGSIWLGSKNGIWHFGSGRLERTLLPENNRNLTVQAMAEDGAGGLWVSLVGKGVFRLSNGKWTSRGDIADLPKLTAITLSTDAKKRVWFGYTEGRIAVLDGGSVTFFTDNRRSPVGNVTAIYGKRKAVWVGGESGLALFDGVRFQQVTLESGAEITNVTGIVETADGDLWVNCGAGIAHFSSNEIRRGVDASRYRLQGEVFDMLDGVEGSPTTIRPLPTAVEAGDGKLWFARNVKIYSIDPAHLFRNRLAPPVMVQSIDVDGTAYASASELKLPQQTTSLRIDYVAPSLTLAEKVRYRYKLDGVDKGWQDAQGRRQAFYTNLAPGSYRFKVIAANNDGVWNETGATLDFVIPPTFVQTKWFIALCALAAALAIWLLIRLRFSQLAARMRERFDERIAERERIARELHDTLLQSTQGLILRVQAATTDVAPGDPARSKLESALEQADRVIAEGRDRILDLRVAEDASSDLPVALSAVGEEFAKGQTASFLITVEGSARALNPVVRDEAYRIAREALLNAFRHAQARSIEVQIIYADKDLRIRIRDDGIGIDAGQLEVGSRAGHWGLPGMRERALRIGAQIEMWSRSGVGTEIELRISAKMGYAGRSRPPRWLPFRRPA